MAEPGQNRKIAALRSSNCVYLFILGDIMDKYMQIALKEAQKSLLTDDVPIGAVIVENDTIIAKGHNTREKTHLITRHAEINAIEKACKKKKTWHLDNCVLYVTLEPCKMCMEVIKQARIKQVIYAAKQEKQANLKDPDMVKLENVENSSILLKEFFKNKRK